MANLQITKEQLPFWLRGSGTLDVSVPVSDLNKPLPRGATDLVNVEYQAQGNDKLELGRDMTLTIGIQAGSQFKVKPIWDASNPADQQLLAGFGMEHYLENHPDQLIFYLDSGMKGEATLGGKYQYSALTASIQLEAGVDMRYQYLRPAPASRVLAQNLTEYFAGLRLPANVTAPPLPGEAISFEYGGKLRMAGSAGLGYELVGSPSFNVGQLQLSESYQLAVLAGLQLGADIAGRFAVEVKAAPDELGRDWAQVVVRKAKTKGLQIAADITVTASGDLRGLPDTPNELLGAALGVNAKNWLNLLGMVQEWSDFTTLESNLDDLAKRFIGEWIGKGFDELNKKEEFTAFLSRVRKVVASYDSVDQHAITLFDGYFNRLDLLTSKLEELVQLTSWDRLRGSVDPTLWDVVNQLTGGDPLGWITGTIVRQGGSGLPSQANPLEMLRDRARQALDLARTEAHAEIRNVISLAKKKFGLDQFINQLKELDTPQKLQAQANERAGFFAERLIGQSIKGLEKSSLKSAFDRIHNSLTQVEGFEKNVYAKFEEAAKQSFHFGLHAEYNRRRANDVLVDVLINLSKEEGKTLMRAAGRGDFSKVLAGTSPDLVRINEAILDSRLLRESSFKINLEGWHFNWMYTGFDRVLTETEQRVQPAGNGGIIVYTTLEAKKERERRRNGERIYTCFLVRLLGESGGKVRAGNAAFSKRNQQYLIDVLAGMAANYQILLEDQSTTVEELKYYLSFAREFGLDRAGARIDLLQNVLPSTLEKGKPNYGNVSADYRVVYSEATLQKMLGVRHDDNTGMTIRNIMRKIVLANYTQRPEKSFLSAVGWAYWTESVRKYWKQEGSNFLNHSSLSFIPDASPFEGLTLPVKAGDGKLYLNREQISVLNTLYRIEDHLVGGIQNFYTALQNPGMIEPRELESAVSGIFDALKAYDDFDEGDNTVFAVFDQLVHLADASPGVRRSTLQLAAEVTPAGQPEPVKANMVFTTDAEAATTADEPERARGAAGTGT